MERLEGDALAYHLRLVERFNAAMQRLQQAQQALNEAQTVAIEAQGALKSHHDYQTERLGLEDGQYIDLEGRVVQGGSEAMQVMGQIASRTRN